MHSLLSDLAIDGHGGVAVSASSDGTIRTWDLQTGACRWVGRHDGRVEGADVCSDGRLVVSASEDLTIRVWDGSSGRALATFTGDAGFTGCVVTGDGREIVGTEPPPVTSP